MFIINYINSYCIILFLREEVLQVILLQILYPTEGFQGTVEVSSVDQLVPASDEVIVALFYTNWCGYCKRFKPKFNELISKLEGINNNRASGRVSLKMVNCEVSLKICGRNGINAG